MQRESIATPVPKEGTATPVQRDGEGNENPVQRRGTPSPFPIDPIPPSIPMTARASPIDRDLDKTPTQADYTPASTPEKCTASYENDLLSAFTKLLESMKLLQKPVTLLDEIDYAFMKAKLDGRAAFIPYVVCGFPNKEAPHKIMLEMQRAGAGEHSS